MSPASYLIFSVSVAYIVFILRETFALVEYIELFHSWWPRLNLNKLFKIEEYNNYFASQPNDYNYFVFLRNSAPNFITNLLACPYCITFWLAAPTLFLELNPLVVAFLSSCLYCILTSLMNLTVLLKSKNK